MLIADMENLDMEAVSRVAQKAVLGEIYIVDAKVRRDPLNIGPGGLSLEQKCATKILLKGGDKEVLLVLCNFRVAAFNKKSPDKVFMSIEASFCASYILKPIGEFNPNDIEQFAKINPIYNAWAYWREFVQSMTTRMGFPALTVPLLKIIPKKSMAKKVKSQGVKKESMHQKKLNA